MAVGELWTRSRREPPTLLADYDLRALISRAVCRSLVGREQELSTLEDALLGACRGEGTVVVLAGDAGMGKSRLCAELTARAEQIGAAVLEGSCSEADLALPYLPFLEAIGNYLATPAAAGLGERLGVHGRELAKVFPQFAVEGQAPDGQDTPDARMRLFEALLALLAIASEEHGLLLIVEDLHWADASTRELLDYLTRRLRNRRMLVLATYRRDEMHRKHPLLPTVQGWQRSRLAQIVELQPLEPDGVARMISSIFDNAKVGAEFRDFLHTRSEGNPFVLEEMLKAAMDRGDIYREDEDWKRKPISELRLPETVRDTILLRVERLDSGQAEVLRCSAVLGRSFDYQTLIALCAQDRAAVEAALQTAVQQQLLEEEAGSRGRYRFRHALTQEAIYEDLSAPTRERLHSAAADALAADPRRQPAEVAFHLRAANRWTEAVTVSLEAAAAAEERHGYDEATALYSLLLPVVTAGVERARLLCRLGEAYWLASRPVKAVEPLAEGIRMLEKEGHLPEAAHHRLTLGRCHWERSQTPLARAEYEAALRALEPAGPSRDLAVAYVRLAGLHVFDLDGPAGQRLAELAGQTAEAAGADDLRIWSLNFLGLARAHQGDHEGGIGYLEQSAREALAGGLGDIAGNAFHNLIDRYLQNLQPDRVLEVATNLESLGTERWRASSLLARIVWAHQVGELEASMEAARELLTRADQLDIPIQRRLAIHGLGMCLLDLDRLDEARIHLVRPNHDNPIQDSTGDAWFWIRLHLGADDLAGALVAAEFMLTIPNFGLSEDCTEATVEAFLAAGRTAEAELALAGLLATASPAADLSQRLARARVLLAAGEAEAALPLARESADGFERAGLVLRGARARLFLARVHSEAGNPEGAEAELRRLFDLCRQRGLRLLERKAREGLAELGVIVDGPTAQPAAEAAPEEVGERLVTVMFADVRGYTAMSAERAPEEMVDRISAYQRWAAQEVERHFGVVDKFAGDAVMATFNVSGTRVDHASHALQAALALRDKASLLGLPVGIGIATGAAVVGKLKVGANLSVMGPATNLAARLQSQAAAGEVLLSEEAHHRLQSDVEAEPEQLTLKGFEQPVTAFRMRAPSARLS